MTDAPTISLEIDPGFAGPPSIGHGGYVAGLFVGRWPGATQVTLRRPTPLGAELHLSLADESTELRAGDEVIADARPSELVIDVPTLPTITEATAAEAGSPARTHHDGRGVHPTCFGCGLARPDGDGLRIAAGPVAGRSAGLVAGRWTPDDSMVTDGVVDAHMVVAALDCAGALAFIADDQPAGLLGRITFELYRPLAADDDLVVIGWQIGTDGRKMLAGTAIAGSDGVVAGAASAVWFPFG